jgi:scyllo-inositol 2-dehydrogenase (NADP+)
MIGVGIVGYGFAGRSFHAYLIGRARGIQVRAVATRDPERRERAAREYGVATYPTIDELLGDGAVDVVVLATPHDTHAELAIRVLRAGKHVVVDKPLAITLAEADAMLAASRETGKLLTVFHNRRWDWDFLTVKSALAAGLIGQPYLFEVAVLRYRPPRSWRARENQVGSILHDWGAHLVDHALRLVPAAPTSVFCHISRPTARAGEIGNYAKLLLRFADDTLYQIEMGNLCRVPKPRWYVLGTTGGLIKEGLDPQEVAMLAGDIEAAREAPSERARIVGDVAGTGGETVLESIRGDWTSYYQNLSDHLNDGAPLAVTAEEARQVVAILDAGVRSATTRTVVDLIGV